LRRTGGPTPLATIPDEFIRVSQPKTMPSKPVVFRSCRPLLLPEYIRLSESSSQQMQASGALSSSLDLGGLSTLWLEEREAPIYRYMAGKCQSGSPTE
jgi:hypothetical protein